MQTKSNAFSHVMSKGKSIHLEIQHNILANGFFFVTSLLTEDLDLLLHYMGRKGIPTSSLLKVAIANLLFQLCHPNVKLLVFSQWDY